MAPMKMPKEPRRGANGGPLMDTLGMDENHGVAGICPWAAELTIRYLANVLPDFSLGNDRYRTA